MDFKQLETFSTIVELSGFTKAAEKLGYAQPSITAQIRQLEAELGVKLFDRIGKKVLLTEAGKRFMHYSSSLLRTYGEMKQAVPGMSVPFGSLTIASAESLSIYRLPKVLAEYHRLYPEVAINLKLMGCQEFQNALSNGKVDIAFSIGDKMAGECLTEIAELKEKIGVYAVPGHPLSGKEKVIAADFTGIALLLTGEGCCYRGKFVEALTEYGVIPLTAMETDSIQAIKQAALSGLGVCILPEVAVLEELDSGRLVGLNFDTGGFGIVSQLLCHRDKWMSPALKAFISIS
ncbi:MAG: LysR family transcriptional regulator, partial [Clostridiales bacterium]|nr:LysR family transcriptional regulator [Clostridiales bacterium]